MSNKKIVCVSIDLDSITCYYNIHGLVPPDNIKTIHYTKGLKRFLDLFDTLGIRATLFAIGQDLEEEACGTVLREAAERGHEPANHTWSHPYDLTRLTDIRMKKEIMMAHGTINTVTGRAPVGFRAPGYHISNSLRGHLMQAGYTYDASLLPSPPYYLTKSSVILLSLVKGRKSHSIIGGAGMTFSPGVPYRSGHLYWLRGGGLLEIPCTVVTPLRIPFIGTAVTLFSNRTLSILMRFLKNRSFLSIELHAIDLMDAGIDGFGTLAPYQPDAGIGLDEKKRKLKDTLSRILFDFGFEPMTLERAADHFYKPPETYE